MNDNDLGLALERLVAERKRVAPPPTLGQKVWAIPVATADERRWLPRIDTGGSTMFSAVKLIAAGVIVALFGGVLLAGVLTTPQGDEMAPAAVTESPSPMTTEELLSGMVTEEVQTGVYRVIDDGAEHEFPLMGVDHHLNVDAIHVGIDGSVWLRASPCCSDNDAPDLADCMLLRLGVPGEHERSPDGFPCGPSTAMAPDGTLWVGGDHIASHDGVRWTVHGGEGAGLPSSGMPGYWVQVQPDGTVWATWHDGLGRLGDEGWETWGTQEGIPAWVHGLWVLPDGEVYAASGRYHGSEHRLLRFDDGAWQEVPLPDTGGATRLIGMRLAPDDSLWAHLVSRDFPEGAPRDFEAWWAGRERPDEHLARLDGATWTLPSSADDMPTLLSRSPPWEPVWEIHPDGTIWALGDPDPTDPDRHLSLWSFDGQSWQPRSDEADWLDVGPDETIWTARSDGRDLMTPDGSSWRAYSGLPTLALWSGFSDGFDTAPDGTAWVLARDESGGDGLYVITPEAVAATE